MGSTFSRVGASGKPGAVHTEAILAAENISADVLIDLVRSGLAVARNERLEDEDGAVDVTRMWITEAGQLALAARV